MHNISCMVTWESDFVLHDMEWGMTKFIKESQVWHGKIQFYYDRSYVNMGMGLCVADTESDQGPSMYTSSSLVPSQETTQAHE